MKWNYHLNQRKCNLHKQITNKLDWKMNTCSKNTQLILYHLHEIRVLPNQRTTLKTIKSGTKSLSVDIWLDPLVTCPFVFRGLTVSCPSIVLSTALVPNEDEQNYSGSESKSFTAYHYNLLTKKTQSAFKTLSWTSILKYFVTPRTKLFTILYLSFIMLLHFR